VTLPFLDDRGSRIGSLTLWQAPDGVESPLPHFHAIAGELRGHVEAKLLTLWPGANGPRATPSGGTPSGPDAPSGDRAWEQGRVPSGSGPAVPVA
jgi:hypothetical protein